MKKKDARKKNDSFSSEELFKRLASPKGTNRGKDETSDIEYQNP